MRLFMNEYDNDTLTTMWNIITLIVIITALISMLVFMNGIIFSASAFLLKLSFAGMINSFILFGIMMFISKYK